jgi:hypothetical protein
MIKIQGKVSEDRWKKVEWGELKEQKFTNEPDVNIYYGHLNTHTLMQAAPGEKLLGK